MEEVRVSRVPEALYRVPHVDLVEISIYTTPSRVLSCDVHNIYKYPGDLPLCL
jgi:hypothetical protein